jgi:anti-sigma regulatory factor (Ser/Thr protein kinase)
MAPLSCRVRRDGPLICVSVDGRMTMAAVPSLRTMLLKCLADSPSAVIVDLSGATVVELTALSVFPAVRRHAADWPPTPMLLCGLDRFAVPPQSRRLWIGELPVYDDLRSAKAAAARPDLLTRRVQSRLPDSAQAPARAREVLGTACRTWHVEHLLPVAEVIVSELASNAICHTSGGGQVVIVRGDRYLHVVVRDTDRRLPALVDDDEWDAAGEGGRGLRLVRALAASWGAKQVPDGKVVWATIPLRPAAARARSHRG